LGSPLVGLSICINYKLYYDICQAFLATRYKLVCNWLPATQVASSDRPGYVSDFETDTMVQGAGAGQTRDYLFLDKKVCYNCNQQPVGYRRRKRKRIVTDLQLDSNYPTSPSLGWLMDLVLPTSAYVTVSSGHLRAGDLRLRR